MENISNLQQVKEKKRRERQQFKKTGHLASFLLMYVIYKRFGGTPTTIFLNFLVGYELQTCIEYLLGRFNNSSDA